MRLSTAGLVLALATPRVLSQGTDLGGGVVTRVDVEYLADLSLDVRDIAQFIATEGGSAIATEIYVDGRNSETAPGIKYPMYKLINDLANDGVGKATPNYLFHLYGLSDESKDTTKLQGNSRYADSFVRSALTGGKENAGTAALVLIVWMYATHALYHGFEICQKMALADNPGQFTLAGGGMDEFIGLWIGSAQQPASNVGFGLYAFAERAGTFFGTGSEADESDVNANIKSLYQQGASIVSIENACSKNEPDSPRLLWSIAHQIVGQMHIPLMQMLIKSIVDRDEEATRLYALAVVPQIAQCRPSIFKRLDEDLLNGSPQFSKADQILSDLQKVYSCLGFTCAEIGTYTSTSNGGSAKCPALEFSVPMALYQPTSNVHSIARIDLDILQLRILTSLGSFNFAKHLYSYGRNSPVQRDSDNDLYEFHSIGKFATAVSRRNAEPWLSAFVKYYNEPNYADVVIRNTLDGTGKWGSKSTAQRSAVITEMSSFHVLFLHLIAQINDAVNSCNGVDVDGEYDLTHPWDEVAALMIGSLEGENEGGSSDSQDGQLIWGLANQRDFEFQTLNKDGYANVNSDLLDYLFAGKGELDALDCANLERTATRIKRGVLVPLMQSTLRYAIENDQLDSSSSSANLALGEVYALAIIPIIQLFDLPAADILQQNMVVESGIEVVRDGSQAVANALGAAAIANGMGCEPIGYTSQADPCRNYGRSSASTLRPLLSLVGIVGAWFIL